MEREKYGAERVRHGGEPGVGMALNGLRISEWLDLSTGINPVPYPIPELSPETLTRLPSRSALAALIDAARVAYGVPAGINLIAAPGTELAIRLLPQVAPEGDVAIVSPTYGSHADAWRKAGRRVSEIESIEAVPSSAAIVVVGNPNNPNGRTAEPTPLAELARKLGERGGLLVVDEAFADVAPEVSIIPQVTDLPALVLRSLGKFYGLPGLRLGFVAGPHAIVDRLAALLGDWPVSGPAIAIGTASLRDKKWRATTRERLKKDMARLHGLLAGGGLAIRGGTDLFALVETPDATRLHDGLARHGIWTRVFAERPNWIRVGLPGSDADFDRLDRALTAIG
jgi:cobalamin biosynthetic protein CobC